MQIKLFEWKIKIFMSTKCTFKITSSEVQNEIQQQTGILDWSLTKFVEFFSWFSTRDHIINILESATLCRYWTQKFGVQQCSFIHIKLSCKRTCKRFHVEPLGCLHFFVTNPHDYKTKLRKSLCFYLTSVTSEILTLHILNTRTGYTTTITE